MSFPIDPKSGELAASSLECLTRSIQRSATAHIVAEENRLLIVALAKATGIEAPNPYDFIGRLAKHENAEGVTIYFDKAAILWIRRAKTIFADGVMTIKVQYRMLGCDLV